MLVQSQGAGDTHRQVHQCHFIDWGIGELIGYATCCIEVALLLHPTLCRGTSCSVVVHFSSGGIALKFELKRAKQDLIFVVVFHEQK